MEQKKKINLKVLTECAMLVALSCVLSIFPKFKFLAYGGSITFCSMLPIILISYRRGIKWGLLSGLVLAIFQMLTGFSAAGINLFSVFMIVIFDYLAAFTVLGFGGMFKGKFNNVGKELALGSLAVLLLRLLSYIISGFFVWGEYAEWFFEQMGELGQTIIANVHGNLFPLLYSVVYNASYMIPEIIITVVVSLLFSKYALINIKNEGTALTQKGE